MSACFSWEAMFNSTTPIGILQSHTRTLRTLLPRVHDATWRPFTRHAPPPAGSAKSCRLPATVFDLSERERAELAEFFVAATLFEKKDVRLLGWDGPEQAHAFLRSWLT